MAESYSHTWGQIIGVLLEEAVGQVLRPIAQSHSLYIDSKGPRKARKGAKLVRWLDEYGNYHILDYVLERGGTVDSVGLPVAFVETAWRRYKKHAKNKAQELEGALVPLNHTYRHSHPFLGCVLAGDFTPSSITQLTSRGFKLVHISTSDVFGCFADLGFDARFGEDTPESQFRDMIQSWNKGPPEQKSILKNQLILRAPDQMKSFVGALESSISRNVLSVSVTALHGNARSLQTVQAASDYIGTYAGGTAGPDPLLKYELDVRYSNGDTIHGVFADGSEAIRFLETFL